MDNLVHEGCRVEIVIRCGLWSLLAYCKILQYRIDFVYAAKMGPPLSLWRTKIKCPLLLISSGLWKAQGLQRLALVILPALMVSRVAFSKSWQKVCNSLLPSSWPLNARPRVQAKMEATGFVDVGWPFWYCLQWRVTVPAFRYFCTQQPHQSQAYHILPTATKLAEYSSLLYSSACSLIGDMWQQHWLEGGESGHAGNLPNERRIRM